MKATKMNEEVLYTAAAITKINRKDIEILKKKASLNSRKRIRLCTHQNTHDPLHEMLIIHSKGAYIRPHKHPQKSESFHIVEGRLRVVIFNDTGKISEIINMGDYLSKEKFYYRLPQNIFHTVIPLSEVVVFHETTNGPFIYQDAIFASWAPSDHDIRKQKAYLKALTQQMELRDTD